MVCLGYVGSLNKNSLCYTYVVVFGCYHDLGYLLAWFLVRRYFSRVILGRRCIDLPSCIFNTCDFHPTFMIIIVSSSRFAYSAWAIYIFWVNSNCYERCSFFADFPSLLQRTYQCVRVLNAHIYGLDERGFV